MNFLAVVFEIVEYLFCFALVLFSNIHKSLRCMDCIKIACLHLDSRFSSALAE